MLKNSLEKEQYICLFHKLRVGSNHDNYEPLKEV